MFNINKVNIAKTDGDIKSQDRVQRKVKFQPVQDNVQLTSKKIDSALTEPDNSKVTFKEGFNLIKKGFVNKVKDIAKSIIKHPIKTAGIMIAATAALSALPLMGISTALGASVLALGFAGIAIGKTTAHTVKAIKHNKNEEYAELRKDLGKIGGDCLDLALSMPFVPKAIKNIKRNIQYAPSIALNKELWANIKNAKGPGAKYTELLKGDVQINYETISNEMGLKTKPKLVFDDTMQFDIMNGVAAGEFEPTKAIMKINPKTLNPISRMLLKINPEAIIKHELTHFKQFSDIARTEGIGVNGLKNILTEYYKKALEMGESVLPLDNLKNAKNLLQGDGSLFNAKFYETIAKERGIIPGGSKEAAEVQSYIDGFMAKVTTDVNKINNLNINPIFGPSMKDMKKILKIYKENSLESPAFAAQDSYTKEIIKFRPNVAKDILTAESLSQNE